MDYNLKYHVYLIMVIIFIIKTLHTLFLIATIIFIFAIIILLFNFHAFFIRLW